MFKPIYMHMHGNGVYFHQKQRIKKKDSLSEMITIFQIRVKLVGFYMYLYLQINGLKTRFVNINRK